VQQLVYNILNLYNSTLYIFKIKMKGKVAIVTASSTGIGKGIVQRLAKEGCSVIVSSRNQTHVN